MAVRKESGRRYSKVTKTTFNVDEFAQAFAELGTVKPFQQRVDDVVASAREFLAGRDIPGCAQLFRSQKSGEYTCTEPEYRDRGGFCALDIFVLKHLDLERDSFEHLAARVIVAADAMQRREGEHSLEAAFELGTLEILSRVYAMESRGAKRRGGKPKRRWWADVLDEQITSWDDIPESYAPMEIETDQADLKIYRDGDSVVCKIEDDRGERTQKLARSTFEKRYMRRSLK
jgi:hypothetical protein